MGAVNGESVWWTSSSRSFNTHPLRAFIMKSILSFIICISTTIWGGAVSVPIGRLVSYRSCLLGAWPFLFPSFCAGCFLIFLLGILRHVPLTQLLFQTVVLLSEAFHGSSESLNLSFEGHYTWFVSQNVVGGHHQARKYHATLLFGKRSYGLQVAFSYSRHQLMMPKNHQWATQSLYTRNNTYMTKRRPNRKHRCGAGQIPSEGQVRTLHNSRVSKLREIMHSFFQRVFGFLQ